MLKVDLDELKKLIAVVKTKPLLYKHIRRGNLGEEQDAWDAIAAIMGRKDMTGPLWKKKWKNTRDTYIRYKREMETSADAKKVHRAKNWSLMKDMAFLSSDKNDEIKIETAVNHDCTTESPQASICSAAGSDEEDQCLRMEQDFQQVDSITCADNMHCREGYVHDMVPAMDKSTNQLFLDSIVVRMEELPRSKQHYLQLQILQLLMNAEDPNLRLPITPIPC